MTDNAHMLFDCITSIAILSTDHSDVKVVRADEPIARVITIFSNFERVINGDTGINPLDKIENSFMLCAFDFIKKSKFNFTF